MRSGLVVAVLMALSLRAVPPLTTVFESWHRVTLTPALAERVISGCIGRTSVKGPATNPARQGGH